MGAEVMGEIWECAKKVRSRLQSSGNVLQVSGTGGALIWIVLLSPIGSKR